MESETYRERAMRLGRENDPEVPDWMQRQAEALKAFTEPVKDGEGSDPDYGF